MKSFKKHLILADKLEAFAKNFDFKILPRNLNICTVFPFVDIFFSDNRSSTLGEFLPFGAAINVCDDNYDQKKSILSDFVPNFSPHNLFSLKINNFKRIIKLQNKINSKKKNLFIKYDKKENVGNEIALTIKNYIKTNTPKIPSVYQFYLQKIRRKIFQ